MHIETQWAPCRSRPRVYSLPERGNHFADQTLGANRGIQERLGHSRISQTLDTYSHVIPELHEETASVLEDALCLDASL